MTQPPPPPRPLSWRSAATAFTVGAVRGGNQVAIKLALLSFAPLWTAFGRMAVSVATIFALSRWDRITLRPESHERRPLILLSLIFTVQISMLHWGADLTSPAYAVVLVNTNPIFANLISHFFVPEDRLSGRRVFGLALAFAGVSGVFLGQPDAGLAPNPLLGNALMVLSGLMVGARTVYIQRIVQRMPTARAVFWQMLLSLPCFALAASITPDRIERMDVQWESLAAITYQGLIVGGVALIAWVRLLKRHTPGTISVFSFVTPMAGLVLAALLFG